MPVVYLRMRTRFIPVYTGNTQIVLNKPFACPVYPCVYREHRTDVGNANRYIGLSLCIQGTLMNLLPKKCPSRFIPVYTGNTLRSLRLFYICRRFIPVYTGNTRSTTRSASTIAVYPCVYREHDHHSVKICTVCGLSLCIQGTPVISLFGLGFGRFIPVYTGNTRSEC